MVERDEVFRIRTTRRPGTLARALTAVGECGATIGEIETIHIGPEHNIRDVTVIAPDDDTVERIHQALKEMPDIDVLDEPVDKVWAQHEGGKIQVVSRAVVRNLQDIREVYTPGVARVVNAIADDASLADDLTWRGRTVAIVTNGTRVLGLGNVGPTAALPVMEGKALFYSMLVDLNAVPLVLDAPTADDVVEAVTRIAPGFGGIHLEDIATPDVYEIEERLESALDIPVFHDDQHGTAVVLLAAVIVAARSVGRELGTLTFGQVGLGAAGSAIAALASGLGFQRILGYDPGPAAASRLQRIADRDAIVEAGSDDAAFDRVVADADVLVLATGKGGLLAPERIKPGQIVMALTNPVPEISTEEARRAGAAVAADGTIVNNVLGYPGLIKGALDARAASITPAMKRAAVQALADQASPDLLLPDPLDVAVHARVAEAVAAAAIG